MMQILKTKQFRMAALAICATVVIGANPLGTAIGAGVTVIAGHSAAMLGTGKFVGDCVGGALALAGTTLSERLKESKATQPKNEKLAEVKASKPSRSRSCYQAFDMGPVGTA